ncbi:helix-turn-helix domain-containing protein [Microbacterium sp. DT81.1]|uniref:helix-turn-helix domain-containing protein n=1 Tax=Microbacterium sp. DT81.1 TaxID=3393413 RepID=UPI003CF4B932
MCPTPLARDPAPDDLLFISETAAILRLHHQSVRKLIRDGQLSAIRVGRTYRIRRSDLDSWIQRQPTTHERHDG